MPFDTALEYSAQKNAEARSAEDFKDGVNSFVNKKHLEWE